ncbi:MAG: hypothetical protein OXJ52_07175 [Oligoflexia bacterium]|nr:hypothetical protein [Oligoflexia bacterium]
MAYLKIKNSRGFNRLRATNSLSQWTSSDFSFSQYRATLLLGGVEQLKHKRESSLGRTQIQQTNAKWKAL